MRRHHDTARLAERFATFARDVFAGSSPLYQRLALGVAADPDLLDLATWATPKQPVPNLLFATVHFLLLQGARHPLAAYYPSLTTDPAGERLRLEQTDPYPLFRSFCLEYRDAVRGLIATRRVQTNEVRRCACLLPAFCLVAGKAEPMPLAMVEIGASAGLNLRWDRYGYDYGGQRCGDPNAPVQIACELRGDGRPSLSADLPRVVARAGIDIHPIDVTNREKALWLRALVWPEQVGRAALLARALDAARTEPPPLVEGDALERLTEVLDAMPPEAALCVFHTFTVNQFTPEDRERLSGLLAAYTARLTKGRLLFRVSIESHTWPPALDLTTYENGAPIVRNLASCDQHGGWLEWLSASPSPQAAP